MAIDMAAISESALMYSHGARSPDFTITPNASMMWVWGEIGYVHTTSGRQRATAWATAREPSICASMLELLLLVDHVVVRRFGRGDVGLAHWPGEALADGPGDGTQRHDSGQGGEPAQQGRIGGGMRRATHGER